MSLRIAPRTKEVVRVAPIARFGVPSYPVKCCSITGYRELKGEPGFPLYLHSCVNKIGTCLGFSIAC